MMMIIPSLLVDCCSLCDCGGGVHADDDNAQSSGSLLHAL